MVLSQMFSLKYFNEDNVICQAVKPLSITVKSLVTRECIRNENGVTEMNIYLNGIHIHTDKYVLSILLLSILFIFLYFKTKIMHW